MSIEEQLKLLPHKPGVYLMKNSVGHVIYVGKAISLRNRVRSYFQNSRHHTPKTKTMVEQIENIEYIITDSEVEALILENNLIKEHSPKYNIRLRDDKTYPYIKVTANEEYPRVYVTRRRIRDGAKYYGPFTNVDASHETVRLLKRIFPLRDCRQPVRVGQRTRPCLNYYISKCCGPCVGKVPKEDYKEMIDKIVLFLEGRQEQLIKDLKAEMNAAAENLDFEKAAALRDKVKSVEKIVEKQKIEYDSENDQDVIAVAHNDNLACVQVFLIRDGRMVGRDHFYLEKTLESDASDIVDAFLQHYYNDAQFIPKEIIVQVEVPGKETLEEWLSKKKNSKVALHTPKRGDKLKLVEMGSRNAEMLLEQAGVKQQLEDTKLTEALEVLAEYLSLPEAPYRIECYDISNIQGTETVASMVVFEGGKPKNSDYRRFKIKTVEGPNDFASMAEVIGRRFKRAQDSEPEDVQKFGAIPDLVIIDGGKGQLSSARRVMKELGFDWVPTVGLAKEFEYLFVEGSSDPIILPRNSQALYLVQRVRDEAHRFAITYHRSLRGKSAVRSSLDEIPGIGKKRRLALIEIFGSIEGIKKATVSELSKVPGMNKAAAEVVHEHLHR